MSRIYIQKISIVFFILFFTSCATHKAKYSDSVSDWNKKTLNTNGEIDHTFYFIGDAGNAKEDESLEHLSILKEELKSASENSTVLFLGDNIYHEGLPKKNHPERKLAEHRLNTQIDLVQDFKGQPIFIPGNHDYKTDGIKGLERQADYIKNKLDDKNTFLPKKGCPIKKLQLSDEVVLIIIDTQWYLENWDNNPTMNDDCDIKSREEFFAEFESLIKKYASKTTVIAMHHPMFTNGTHGGQFSLKQQLFPLNNNVPLPVLGSIASLVRKVGGTSKQDLQNPLYRELKKERK